MFEPPFLTGRLIAAARALTGISLDVLAKAAGLDAETMRLAEDNGSACLSSAEESAAIIEALERFGAVFLAEGDGLGAGVRLKFTRLDVKQITRMEGEGGPAGDDDVP
ncbi:hypothetical protein K32_29820 [Kaistia sp. 32K]|uniref:XRE family transcriptional regulator n=1 Tax=Kaistia sp. 32K TaxID=2795690 RepID=UPI001915C1A9|nr:XRE family transcriptional regulator [Kaistia sp. 32K]BCP54365.1 hypothetical protein K32_29820 [Kaistia sp. 32K]